MFFAGGLYRYRFFIELLLFTGSLNERRFFYKFLLLTGSLNRDWFFNRLIFKLLLFSRCLFGFSFEFLLLVGIALLLRFEFLFLRVRHNNIFRVELFSHIFLFSKNLEHRDIDPELRQFFVELFGPNSERLGTSEIKN